MLDGDGWSTPRPGRFTPGKDRVPIVQDDGWAPGPVWTGVGNLAVPPVPRISWEAHEGYSPGGIRTLNCELLWHNTLPVSTYTELTFRSNCALEHYITQFNVINWSFCQVLGVEFWPALIQSVTRFHNKQGSTGKSGYALSGTPTRNTSTTDHLRLVLPHESVEHWKLIVRQEINTEDAIQVLVSKYARLHCTTLIRLHCLLSDQDLLLKNEVPFTLNASNCTFM